MKTSSAFSLLELLVSIVILAILLAVGVEVGKGVLEKRDEQVCRANLRQVYLLTQAYVADHNGRYPPIISDSVNNVTLHWRRAILPYMGLNSSGSGVRADVFNSRLVCPARNRRPEVPPAFRGISNFGLNSNLGDPEAPLSRGIPAVRVRLPSQFFFATETFLTAEGLPQEAIKANDCSNDALKWGGHRKTRQNVMFADGHIEVFENVRELISNQRVAGGNADAWTP